MSLCCSVVTIDVALSDIVEFPGKGLLAMLQSEKHSDLSFIVEDKVVRVHRVVMASQSSYFDRLGGMLDVGLVVVTSLASIIVCQVSEWAIRIYVAVTGRKLTLVIEIQTAITKDCQ